LRVLQHGLLRTDSGDYFIEPVRGHPSANEINTPHIVYAADQHSVDVKTVGEACGVTEGRIRTYNSHSSRLSMPYTDEQSKSGNRKRRKTKKRRTRRSVSLERNVEVLVVADKSMTEFYKDDDLDMYILTVMNMVGLSIFEGSILNGVPSGFYYLP
jgi:hypothetical protein